MKKIISDKFIRIVKAKKKLEKELDVEITNRGKEIFIEGSPEDEYIAEKVLDAINFGFEISKAIEIKKETLDFEIINIKDYSHNKKLKTVRGRIIGKGGKALQTISNLTDCYFELSENKVGIICNPENMENAQEAIIQLVRGAKHGHVYNNLERNRPKPLTDLGLKNKE